jgi:hypothetical protein
MFATVALLLASTPQLIAYWPGNGNAVFASYRQPLNGSVAKVKIYSGALPKPGYKPLG